MHIKSSLYYQLVLAVILLIPNVLFAQDSAYPKQMGIGFKTGATMSTLVVSIPIQQMKGNYVPTYGIVFSYIDKKIVGLQLELNYVSKSWEEKTIDNYIFNSTVDYLEIPMFTTFHFGNRLKFIANFGPYLSIRLSQQNSHDIPADSENFPYYDKRDARKGDFGLNGGAGFRYETKLGIFQLEGRYVYSFQNIYDTEINSLEYSVLSTLGVYLSYQFLLSK